jgi:transposase InsO family protein
LREWVCAAAYQSSAERAAAMSAWLCTYNSRRPHSALGGKPPLSRIKKDNLLQKNKPRRVRTFSARSDGTIIR